MEFVKSITNDELLTKPLDWYKGDIVLIDNPEDVAYGLTFLSGEKVVGFDTETRPAFSKGRSNKVALLQLATAEIVLLFRLNKIGLPAPLINFLSNPNIIKVGVAIHDDIKALKKLRNFEASGFFELQKYVKKLGFDSFSLRKLAAIVLGFKVSKNKQLSNWEEDILSEAQQLYAATDAWAAYLIYVTLTKTFPPDKTYPEGGIFVNERT